MFVVWIIVRIGYAIHAGCGAIEWLELAIDQTRRFEPKYYLNPPRPAQKQSQYG